MSKRSYNLLKGSLDGYVVVANEKTYASTQEQKKPNTPPVKELTREEMVEFLKGKGINVHHNLGDAKLKERYEIEVKANQ